MHARRHLFVALLVILIQPGCAHKVQAPLPSPAAEQNRLARLRADLDALFSEPRISQAQIGVEVLSLDRAELLYEKNARRLFTPASTNKIITAAVALLRLGPEFRFKTDILAGGKIEEGRLAGNLIIRGSGDPSISPAFHDGDPFAVFENWAGMLRERGVQEIAGTLLASDAVSDGSGIGSGWEWNDLPYSYAAPPGSLQFNDNVLTLEITPAAAANAPAQILTLPVQDFLKIQNSVLTGAEGTPPEIQIEYGDSFDTLRVLGTVPAKGNAILQSVSVRRPGQLYLAALQSVLTREGIQVNRSDSQAEAASGLPGGSLLWSHLSPPLPDILKPLLKNSRNLYAETLVRALGSAAGGEATFSRGKAIVQETLAALGIHPGTYVFADGSGLSRLNLQCPDSLVRLLQHMRGNQNFQAFYDALPIAGLDGTLAARMRKTKAENRVRAKTGSMSNVSAIAGYLTTADGELLAFSIMLNNLLGPKGLPESIQDQALERLARFSRN